MAGLTARTKIFFFHFSGSVGGERHVIERGIESSVETVVVFLFADG